MLDLRLPLMTLNCRIQMSHPNLWKRWDAFCENWRFCVRWKPPQGALRGGSADDNVPSVFTDAKKLPLECRFFHETCSIRIRVPQQVTRCKFKSKLQISFSTNRLAIPLCSQHTVLTQTTFSFPNRAQTSRSSFGWKLYDVGENLGRKGGSAKKLAGLVRRKKSLFWWGNARGTLIIGAQDSGKGYRAKNPLIQEFLENDANKRKNASDGFCEWTSAFGSDVWFSGRQIPANSNLGSAQDFWF